MSHSGYRDDDGDDPLQLGRWRGQVTSAIRGKRGQQAFRDLASAMDAMSVKELAAGSLVTENGEFCALGVLCAARGIDMQPIDPEDWDAVSAAVNIASVLARELVWENDEGVSITHDPEGIAAARWQHMRKWVAAQIKDKP